MEFHLYSFVPSDASTNSYASRDLIIDWLRATDKNNFESSVNNPESTTIAVTTKKHLKNAPQEKEPNESHSDLTSRCLKAGERFSF